MLISDYNDHPCPKCGHKIREHTNSIFGHNPKYTIGGVSVECGRLHSELIIEKLTAGWNDAINERDAYAKSLGIVTGMYEEASKNSNDYFESFINMTATASNAAHDRDIYKKKSEIAMEALKGISSLWHGRGLAPRVLEELDKTIKEIESIK